MESQVALLSLVDYPSLNHVFPVAFQMPVYKD